MKKILLTGGSGFIGRNIKESYLAEQYEIIAPSHQELPLDDTAAVDTFFKCQEFDVVLHTAVKPGHRNAKDLSNLLSTNLRIFENLERNKHKYGKFINFGSGAIYDVAQNNAAVSEDDIYKNMGKDDHSFCKYVVHKQIDHLDNFYDLNIFGIFGKYEDYAIRFISNAICQAIFGLPITLRQNRRFSYLDVNDLPPILEWFIENHPKYKSYNIVPNDFIELKTIANLVKDISDEDLEIKIAQEGFGLDYYGSNGRLRKEMPDLVFTPIQTSLQNLFAYYRQNQKNLDKNLLLEDK